MLLLLRAAALWAVATLLVPATGAWALADPGTSSPALAAYLARVAGVALVACAAWAWLVVTCVLVERAATARGRRLRYGWVPERGRRTVAALLGGAALTLGTVGATEAHADPPPTPPGASLPLPERLAPPPAAPSRPSAPAPAPSRTAQQQVHLVVPGDSLWRVAEDTLARRDGSAPSDADVLALVHRLHRTNRAIVGADPDLVHPGQRLRVPRARP